MQKKSDVATEACWGFMERADLMAAIRRQAEFYASTCEGLEVDDLLQEACLWLGVRPHKQEQDIPFVLRGTRDAMNALARPQANRNVLEEEFVDDPSYA